MTWIQPNEAKERVGELLREVAEDSHQLTDTNTPGEKVKKILLVGLTEKDIEHLSTVASYYPRIKNYGVLVRRVIKDRAKDLPAEAQGSLF